MRRFSLAALVAGLAIVATTAAVKTGNASRTESATPSTVINQVGPYFVAQTAYDSTNGNAVGGRVEYFTAGADTMKIGNVVYLSGTNTVRTSTTASDHEKCVGIVVGGRSTSMLASIASADVGTVAAVPGRPVIVLREGRAWVANDATGAVAAGDRLKPSTNVLGKVMGATAAVTATSANPTQATTTIAYANADTIRSGGTTVTSSAANGAIIGHSAATITNGALTAGAVTVAGDGFTKILGTVIKGGNASTTVLADVHGC